MRANASGGAGSVEAVAQMRMRDGDNGGALLTYEADANVTGPLAGVGQRLVGSAAKRTTREFLEGLDREIQSPDGAAGTRPTTPEKARTLRPGPRHGPRHRPGRDRPQRAGRLPAGADRRRRRALDRPPLTPDGAEDFPRQHRRGGGAMGSAIGRIWKLHGDGRSVSPGEPPLDIADGDFPRVVHEDTELGGVDLPAGSRMASPSPPPTATSATGRTRTASTCAGRPSAISRSPVGRTSAPARTSRASRSRTPRPALLALPGIRLATTDVRYQGWVFRGPARLDATWHCE